MTQNPKAVGVSIALNPVVEVFNDLAMLAAASMQMVDREKLKTMFATARAAARSAAVVVDDTQFLARITSRLIQSTNIAIGIVGRHRFRILCFWIGFINGSRNRSYTRLAKRGQAVLRSRIAMIGVGAFGDIAAAARLVCGRFSISADALFVRCPPLTLIFFLAHLAAVIETVFGTAINGEFVARFVRPAAATLLGFHKCLRVIVSLWLAFSNNTGGSITPTASQVYQVVALRS